MSLQVINKIVGSVSILLNLAVFFPFTWQILYMVGVGQTGSFEDLEIVFFHVVLYFNLFILTGILAWFNSGLKNDKRIKTALTAILFILIIWALRIWTLEAWKYMGREIHSVATSLTIILMAIFLALIGLMLYKKLKIGQTLLITNIVGIVIMLILKEVLGLPIDTFMKVGDL